MRVVSPRGGLLRNSLVLLVLLVIVPTASAFKPGHQHKEGWERADGKEPRRNVLLSPYLPLSRTQVWHQFVDRTDGTWRAAWDAKRGVPSRMFGQGIVVPGSVAESDTAAKHARSVLRDHIALLAPGARAEDFKLVSNNLTNGMRSVGFVQRYDGLRVLGGQLSFRYKNDRLFMISSQAWPDVDVPRPLAAVPPPAAETFAHAWMSSVAEDARATDVSGPFILPLEAEDGDRRFAHVLRVDVEATHPVGQWEVYVDSSSGAPVARRQRLAFAEGTALINTPARWPGSARMDFAAQDVDITINGGASTTDPHGVITFPEQTVNVVLNVQSDVVSLTNRAGDNAKRTFSLSPGGTLTWEESSDELLDAQLTAFVHARVAKDWARNINPDLAWLNERIPVNVNINDSCNAFSDGNSINFFKSSTQCGNTARLVDVVYHEFGHSLHQNSLIEGVGSFDGAHSEGLSDYLAATITEDPGMGRGFFKSNGPLRHIDPPDKEHRWPDDIGGIHFTGLIFAGAMWDLRTMLVEKLGPEAGVLLADQLFYATLQRATDIPSTYFEVLAADDDDGNLDNGTPNECDINAAFGLHGLRAVAADVAQPTVELVSEAGHEIAVSLGGLSNRCPGDTVAAAQLRYTTEVDSNDAVQTVSMNAVASEDYEFAGLIPEVPEGTVVRYQIYVEFSDGTNKVFPENPADPYYEFFVGDVEVLYCNSFDEDPFENGWSHGLVAGEETDGANDWAWGPLASPPASGDPSASFTGEFAVGNDLGGQNFNGKYQADKHNFAQAPTIDVGQYTDVHLQYFRWLNVEDAFFDKASIYANEELAWRNLNSNMGNSSSTHHSDRVWRFHDVPVSRYTRDHTLDLRFELESDGGLEFGGWTIDDVCVVALKSSVCGDGEITGAEQCDDAAANSDTEVDACRTSCFFPYCGDGVVDDGEQCDDGNNDTGDDCTPGCRIPDTGCGCRLSGQTPQQIFGTLFLFALVALVIVRRRN